MLLKTNNTFLKLANKAHLLIILFNLQSHNKLRNRQQIEELSEQFQAALLAYDEGIMSDDRVLAGALWRRFFAMNCDDSVQIERLVKYVRHQVAILDQTPCDEFMFKPKIHWLKLENIRV